MLLTYDVRVEFKDHAASGSAADGNVEENLRPGHGVYVCMGLRSPCSVRLTGRIEITLARGCGNVAAQQRRSL